ncbi:MAG: peptidylprolyl isomerase [Planctomycetota bacterium]
MIATRPGIALFAMCVLLGGCSGTPQSPSRPDQADQLVLERSPSVPKGTPPSALPNQAPENRAAVIDGSVIPWNTLRGPLSEAAGRVVLEEIALDRTLDRALDRAGIVRTEAMVDAEEQALLDELAGVSGAPDRAAILERIRQTRGLGPRRYRGLLERNAGLRALIREQAEPESAELELARSIAFGPAHRIRLFVGVSERAAADARSRAMASDPPQRRWTFADACAEHSTHPSASRGGLIERFSHSDPAYPDILRDAVRTMAPGEISPVLLTSAGFAVVLVESSHLPRTPTADDIARVEGRIRTRKQRIAMESLAAQLLGQTTISPVDPDLARAWRER